MKKPTVKAQLAEANLNLDRTFLYHYTLLGEERSFNLILQMLDFNLKDLDDRIEDETNYAKENPPGSTYGSAGNDARRKVKKLQKARKEVVKTMTMFNQFVKQKSKSDKSW